MVLLITVFEVRCVQSIEEIICIGDMNIYMFNLSNPIFDCFGAYNFEQGIDEPPRVCGNMNTQ